jgi:hypothetical protein
MTNGFSHLLLELLLVILHVHVAREIACILAAIREFVVYAFHYFRYVY